MLARWGSSVGNVCQKAFAAAAGNTGKAPARLALALVAGLAAFGAAASPAEAGKAVGKSAGKGPRV